MRLQIRKEQVEAAARIMGRVGAREAQLGEEDVGAGRPPWMTMEYLTDGAERRMMRVSRSGKEERTYPRGPLPKSDPEYAVPFFGGDGGAEHTDADRDLANDRAEEMDWERSAEEQERW